MNLYGTKVAKTGRMIGFGAFSLITGLCGVLLTTQIASGKSLDGDYNVESQAFPHIKAALVVLSIKYHRRSIRENREYMAAILEENGVYRVMVQAGRRDTDRVRMKIRLKKSQALVALWHTHGAPCARCELYSPTDSNTARRIGVPSYLTTPLGKFKVLRSVESPVFARGGISGTTLCSM